MDIGLLAKFLAPYLPKLLELVQKAAGKGAEKVGEKTAEGILGRVQALWGQLWPKVATKPAALEAAEDLAKAPDDEEALIVFRRQLQKILEDPENADLAVAVARFWQELDPSQLPGIAVTQTTIGNQNQVIGVMQGGTVIHDPYTV